MPFFLAKSSIIAVGSDPIDRRQIIGVLGSLSSHMALRSRITGSAYFGPIESEMYLRACDVVLSGHHDLQHTHTHRQQITSFVSIRVCIFCLNDLPLRSFFYQMTKDKTSVLHSRKEFEFMTKGRK